MKYRKRQRLRKLPSLKNVFFNEKDHTLDDFNEKMENIIEELGNSKNKKIVIMLNEFPILAPHATVSPFKRRWLNVLSLILFPVGIFIYLRAVKFRYRLMKDLIKIEKNSNIITELINKAKLI